MVNLQSCCKYFYIIFRPYRFGYAFVQSAKMIAFWLLLDRYVGQRVETERRAYERGGPDLRDTLLNSYFAEQKLQDEQHGVSKHYFDCESVCFMHYC